MDWLVNIFVNNSVAHSVIIVSLVIAVGMILGNVKVFGIKLGIAGVLFAGLLFGHYKFNLNKEVLEFIRDFGLILFVYTIGMQVGPGFFSSLKKQGLKLNMLAILVVLLDIFITIMLFMFAKIDLPAAVGLLTGATTNTPSLAAVQEILGDFTSSPEILKLPALGYAVSYPFGVIGIILTMGICRFIFKIDLKKESDEFDKFHIQKSENINLEVKNHNIVGMPVSSIPDFFDGNIALSRVLHDDKMDIVKPDTILQIGDIIHAVGPRKELEKLCFIVGDQSALDLRRLESSLNVSSILVTKRNLLGKSTEDLKLTDKYNIKITRIKRAGIEFINSPGINLQFGDILTVIGEEEEIAKVSKELGDSIVKYNEPKLIPIFIGIALGVILGSLPIPIPGLPVPVKLGLAGGPLIAAIILSRIHRIGPLIWHMPISANLMLRDVGITMFLSCVGLKAGDKFLATIMNGNGLYWMACAAIITFVPLLIVAISARLIYKMNFMTLCGVLAGSMTDPPALAFANSLAKSSAPAVAYATVYPLVMIMRILSVQIIILMFFR